MSYVDSQLLPGETVVYRARLHKLIFAGPVITGTIALILLIVAIQIRAELALAAGFAVLSGLSYLWAHVLYAGSEFAVTNKRVIVKVGWIRRRTLETMLSKVEGIGVDQNLLGRLLGFGTIEVTGTGGTKESFKQIARPLEFRRQVQGAISSVDEGRGLSSLPGATGPREERDCPFCAERILVKARVCKHCGREVPAA
jgi:uncharacterized membrane protein YdbT with pleckstrin-like domain